MPTKNKRINLTIPEELYEEIQIFKKESYITTDSAACIQLIKGRLKAFAEGKVMIEALKKMSPEDLDNISREGLNFMRNVDLNQLPDSLPEQPTE
jgi:hypothetical protein